MDVRDELALRAQVITKAVIAVVSDPLNDFLTAVTCDPHVSIVYFQLATFYRLPVIHLSRILVGTVRAHGFRDPGKLVLSTMSFSDLHA